jgi:hypothetical protein
MLIRRSAIGVPIIRPYTIDMVFSRKLRNTPLGEKKTNRLLHRHAEGECPVVLGFQGIFELAPQRCASKKQTLNRSSVVQPVCQ